MGAALNASVHPACRVLRLTWAGTAPDRKHDQRADAQVPYTRVRNLVVRHELPEPVAIDDELFGSAFLVLVGIGWKSSGPIRPGSERYARSLYRGFGSAKNQHAREYAGAKCDKQHRPAADPANHNHRIL